MKMYLKIFSTFLIACYLPLIYSLLFSQLLRMKIVTNTKIKKPVSCMQQNFERKMLSNKDGVVGKEWKFQTHWVRGLS